MLFEDFLPSVLPKVPGCSEAVALHEIVVAARAFCSRTLCWSSEPEPTLTVAGQSTYPLELDDQQERVRLLTAWVGKDEVPARNAMSGRNEVRRGNSCAFVYMENGLDLVVYPTPTADGVEVVAQLAVRPALTATEWPDELAEYVTDIAHGAIAALCLMQNNPWTNIQLSSVHQQLSNDRTSSVAYNVSLGYNTTRQRAGVQWF